MTEDQEQLIDQLLAKYNPILLESMRLAVAEDFINLIIVNKEDTEFKLSELMEDKSNLTNYIFKQFLKQNSSSVVKDLKRMPEQKMGRRKKK